MIGQNILYALSCVPTTGVVNNPHLKDICVPTLPVCKSESPVSVILYRATCLFHGLSLRPLQHDSGQVKDNGKKLTPSL